MPAKPAPWKRIQSRFHLQDGNLRCLTASFLPASVAGWMAGKVLPLDAREAGAGMLGIGDAADHRHRPWVSTALGPSSVFVAR